MDESARRGNTTKALQRRQSPKSCDTGKPSRNGPKRVPVGGGGINGVTAGETAF